MPADKPLCRHCSKRKAVRPRGLCFPCHEDTSIRRQHRPIGKSGAWADAPEPTAEEVERMVNEGMKALPAWWAEQEARELAVIPPPYIPGIRVIRVGR